MILECYNLLKRIEHRPAMWTGEMSLRSIHTYITGYYHALLDKKIVDEVHSIDPFFDWVANKLGFYESTAGWANMILAHSMGFNPEKISWEDVFNTPVTEEHHLKSITLFYELIKQFKDEMENSINY